MADYLRATYVAGSDIHGNGLFALVEIPRGALVGRFRGRSARRDGRFVLWHSNFRRALSVRNKLRWANHSRRPNAEVRRLRLYAARRILPGEEITFHYGRDWRRGP